MEREEMARMMKNMDSLKALRLGFRLWGVGFRVTLALIPRLLRLVRSWGKNWLDQIFSVSTKNF